MNTMFVGIKDFRANISEYVTRARKKNARYIVVNRNKPLFELIPFDEDVSLDTLFSDILAAKRDVREGKLYTHDDILAELS